MSRTLPKVYLPYLLRLSACFLRVELLFRPVHLPGAIVNLPQIPAIMPSQSSPKYPPFPEDVPTVPLLRLSFAKLLAGDQSESERLFSACKSLGFFMLDFQDTSQGRAILEEVETLSGVGAEAFDLDLEEKQRYKMKGDRMFG